jgi:hypothetical protein
MKELLSCTLSLCARQQSAVESQALTDFPSNEPSSITEAGEATFARENMPRLDGSTSTVPLGRIDA